MAHWWQRGVVYQVYPRSFRDASGDGVGDLAGIAGRLDYLTWLGVDAIWISPIYPSPMADFGYDVADYRDVDPLFGDLDAFDRLLEQAHGRGLKVILDLVPNHTSDEHPWFVESRSDRTNPRRDWYLWRDPAPENGPPNNWGSAFGGPAWTLDPRTGQYYLHQFDPKQPELNWRHPEVRAAMYDVMRFWLDRGVDGFRVDVLWMLIKDDQFRDNPANPSWREGDSPLGRLIPLHTEDQPGVHEIVTEMRTLLDAYGERVLIGEIYLPVPRLVRYYGDMLNGAHLPFNFELVLLGDWNAPAVRQVVERYELALPAGAWPNWVLGNHDVRRIATRIGAPAVRVATMLLLTLRGTPTLYYGDELGMEDVPVPAHLAHDPRGRGLGAFGRDPARTPMQWDGGPNAGFCPPGVDPWLPVAPDYRERNVAAEREDPQSLLALTRALLALRRELPALATGGYRTVEDAPEDCFVYRREHAEGRLLIALNFSAAPRTVPLPEPGLAHVLVSTNLDRAGAMEGPSLDLRGHEGCVLRV